MEGFQSSEDSDVSLEEEMGKKMSQSMKRYIDKKSQQEEKNQIFVETPQACFVNDLGQQQDLEQNLQTEKVPICFQKTKKQVNLQNQKTKSCILKSRTTVNIRKQKVTEFFYYQRYIVCKSLRKIIVYHLNEKSTTTIPINYDEFIMASFPPYVFNCIIGQYLHLYSEDTVDEFASLEFEEKLLQQKGKLIPSENKICKQKKDSMSRLENPVIVLKISKMEVETICKYNQGYFMGGYNRSILPGGKKSLRREIYYMEHLDPTINNKPKKKIKIENSVYPVSLIQVQSPYLVVYCKPNFYFFNLRTFELLLTFQKDLRQCFLLEGRYAQNTVNGIGISSRVQGNRDRSIFNFDMESIPIFGVEITEHEQGATRLCMERTGRIFGCESTAIFEYIPSKRLTRCVKIYPQGETVLWIEMSPSNTLLVLRRSASNEYLIEAFSIDQESCIL